MEWFSREKKVAFEDKAADKTEGVPEEYQKLLAESHGKIMVVRRKNVWGLSVYMFARYLRFFLLSLVLLGPLIVLGQFVGEILVSILLLLGLASYIYRGMWAEGRQDKSFVTFSGISYDRFRAAKVGAINAIPLWTIYVVFLFSKMQNDQGLYTIYGWLMMPFSALVHAILPSGYVADAGILQTILLGAIPILYALLFVWGYSFGYQGKTAIPKRKNVDLRV